MGRGASTVGAAVDEGASEASCGCPKVAGLPADASPGSTGGVLSLAVIREMQNQGLRCTKEVFEISYSCPRPPLLGLGVPLQQYCRPHFPLPQVNLVQQCPMTMIETRNETERRKKYSVM